MTYNLEFKPKALKEWSNLRKNSGFRLAYEVNENEIIVLVIKIGKRDKFYENLENYLHS